MKMKKYWTNKKEDPNKINLKTEVDLIKNNKTNKISGY